MTSFQIDNGELDNLAPQQCFVLGYELAQVDSLLRQPDRFEKIVHSQNIERITANCIAADRKIKFTWHSEDSSESWVLLRVDSE